MSQVRRVAGSAALVLVDGVTPLRPEPALFESMLEGWGRQQRSRRLSGPLIESRERLVRRFQAFTMAWPWAWTPEQVEAFRVGNQAYFGGMLWEANNRAGKWVPHESSFLMLRPAAGAVPPFFALIEPLEQLSLAPAVKAHPQILELQRLAGGIVC